MAMNLLGNGLSAAGRHEDALSVREAELATLRRLGASEDRILGAQGNIATTYEKVGRLDEALPLRQEVYSGHLKLHGEEDGETLLSANNYAVSLIGLQRFKEAKSLFRKTMPVARHSLGEGHITTLWMRLNYAHPLYHDAAATLDDLREAVTTLEEIERTAQRVLGGANPTTKSIERSLQEARSFLRAREAPGS